MLDFQDGMRKSHCAPRLRHSLRCDVLAEWHLLPKPKDFWIVRSKKLLLRLNFFRAYAHMVFPPYASMTSKAQLPLLASESPPVTTVDSPMPDRPATRRVTHACARLCPGPYPMCPFRSFPCAAQCKDAIASSVSRRMLPRPKAEKLVDHFLMSCDEDRLGFTMLGQNRTCGGMRTTGVPSASHCFSNA